MSTPPPPTHGTHSPLHAPQLAGSLGRPSRPTYLGDPAVTHFIPQLPTCGTRLGEASGRPVSGPQIGDRR